MPTSRKTTIATLLILGTGQIHAAGFGLDEYSASQIGMAFSGGAAAADEAGTVYANPAGMSLLGEREVMAGLQYVGPKLPFSNEGSGHALFGPLGGGDDSAEVSAVIPSLFYVTPLNQQWHAGIGISAPFGLATSYDETWVGRYHAIDSSLKTLNINPSLAYKASDRLSVGFGISAQHIEVTMSNAIDFGGICVAEEAAGNLAAGTCGFLGLAPQQNDGKVEVTGTDWSLGWNVGLLYQLDDATRVGFSYRSGVSHVLSGTADYTVPAAALPLNATGLFNDGSASSATTLPAIASFSLHHQANERLTLMADLRWTNWAVLDEMRIEFDNPAQGDAVTPTEWRNTWRIAVGGAYAWDDKLTLRGGIAHDQSPVPNDQLRTARIPDASRNWLSLGLGYALESNMDLDVGYSRVFSVSNNIDNADPVMGYQLTGSYNNHADVLGVQLRYRY